MASRGGRGGGGGGGGSVAGRGRGGQWRQVSGRASPATSPAAGQASPQHQQQQSQQQHVRTTRAGSHSQGGQNGAGNGNGVGGVEGKAGDAAGRVWRARGVWAKQLTIYNRQDILSKLRQHMGNRVTLTLRAGARLTGRLSLLADGKPGGPPSATGAQTPSTLVSLEDVVETQRKGPGGAESTGGSMPQLSVGLGQIVAVEIARTESTRTTSGTSHSQAAFRTDKDIANGRATRERELQPWQPDDSAPLPSASGSGASRRDRDQETFGDLSGPSAGWDQFATNEKLFGARSDFDENLYTTRVNRDKANFKAREQEAERLAREILNSDTSNTHVAEERGKDVGGMDEEDKFSGVQRSVNAYVPPGARKGSQSAAQPPQPKPTADPAAPAAAAKAAPAAEVVSAPLSDAPAGKAAPAPGKTAEADRAATAANLPSARKSDKPETPVIRPDVQMQIREFVGTERERLDKKKLAMQRQERERNLSELKKFGKDFQIKAPLPEDMLPIIASTPEKQRAIQEKLRAAQGNGGSQEGRPAQSNASSASPAPKAARASARMQIQEIPPFGGKKPPALEIPPSAGQSVPKVSVDSQGAEPAKPPVAPAAAVPKLNPGASSFVFKPNAAAPQFTPGGAAKSPEAAGTSGLPTAPVSNTLASPAQAGKILTSPRNQVKLPEVRAGDAVPSFFPPTVVKRLTNVNVRDDFNPFKLKVPDPKSVPPAWPFTGKRLAIQPLPGMTAVFGVATSGGEEDSGMFANGQAMQGLAISPSPVPNYPYPPGNMPMRYPMQMPQQMNPMTMPPGPSSPYPPFAANSGFMGGPIYPNPNMPGYMVAPQGPPGNVMGGLRPAAPMMYQGQPPASPHSGSPYAGQATQVSPAPQQ